MASFAYVVPRTGAPLACILRFLDAYFQWSLKCWRLRVRISQVIRRFWTANNRMHGCDHDHHIPMHGLRKAVQGRVRVGRQADEVYCLRNRRSRPGPAPYRRRRNHPDDSRCRVSELSLAVPSVAGVAWQDARVSDVPATVYGARVRRIIRESRTSIEIRLDISPHGPERPGVIADARLTG